MSAMTTLVTGATGFVGGHLLDRLADETPVVAWYRPEGTAPDLARQVDWFAVDLLDRASVARALEESTPARIYHVAGAPQVDTSWRNVVPHLRNNALATHYLLDSVRQAAFPCRILVVSSSQVYQMTDEPISEETPLLPTSPLCPGAGPGAQGNRKNPVGQLLGGILSGSSSSGSSSSSGGNGSGSGSGGLLGGLATLLGGGR